MDSFKVYDLLPNGVIVFKNEKIAYMNKHILDIMNLTDLGQENAIEIIAKTINVSSGDELFSYFSANYYFTHKEKVIQIAQNKYGDIDVFSFLRINPSLICLEPKKIDEATQEKIIPLNIDAKVANFFKLNNIRKIKVLTFYKGLPLKNFGNIIKITNDFIEIEVDNKNTVSLLENNTVLLINNDKKTSSILRGKVISHENNIFRIKNFLLSKEDMHQREGIRVKPRKELLIKAENKIFNVYDISIKGISISVDDVADATFLKNKKSIDLLLESGTITIDTKYLKSIYLNEKLLKTVFTILPQSHVASHIHNYIVERQNEIIREIHEHLEWSK